MSAWTDELKAQVVKLYQDAEPTASNSTEIVEDIANELEQSPNGVRQVLIQAKVYVKKAEADKPAGKTTTSGEATKRVSKESQIDTLREAIKALGAAVDEDIISKLTGKAATYFASVLTTK